MKIKSLTQLVSSFLVSILLFIKCLLNNYDLPKDPDLLIPLFITYIAFNIFFLFPSSSFSLDFSLLISLLFSIIYTCIFSTEIKEELLWLLYSLSLLLLILGSFSGSMTSFSMSFFSWFCFSRSIFSSIVSIANFTLSFLLGEPVFKDDYIDLISVVLVFVVGIFKMVLLPLSLPTFSDPLLTFPL